MRQAALVWGCEEEPQKACRMQHRHVCLVRSVPAGLCAHVQDPDTDTEEQDELMTQQFAALSDCMADECPVVRAAAVAGAAQVCALACLFGGGEGAMLAGLCERLTWPSGAFWSAGVILCWRAAWAHVAGADSRGSKAVQCCAEAGGCILGTCALMSAGHA